MSASTTIVIFGASGDLTWRKLAPSLYNLHRKRRLPAELRIVGFARSDYSDEGFREHLREGVQEFSDYDEAAWASFSEKVFYVQGIYDDTDSAERLNRRLDELEPEGAGRLYYLSVPPKVYAPIIQCLGNANMARPGNGWRRVVVEKPFGHDLESAHKLNEQLHAVFEENQIYRIDHYLGKETVQNILVFRFANTIFEPVWNRNYVSHVQITAAESVGVDHRAGFYDEVGVVRDMFQNHLMQLLALVSMEPPASFEADALRNEKVKVLSAIRASDSAALAKGSARGQYEGYLELEGVAPGSKTATFAALKLYIDNWRWQGVPFYLRSGKALKKKTTDIVIHFKCPPHTMFALRPGEEMRANYIAICIQPDEGIHLRFEAKVPDTPSEMRSVHMEFNYSDNFGPMAIPDAYERLLLDALQGDASLFTRVDEIELSWQIIDTLFAGWQSDQAPPLETYARNSWGPDSAHRLLARAGNAWITGCGGGR